MNICMIVAAALAGFDPYVPFETLDLDADTNAGEFRKIRQEAGLRRFLVAGPCTRNGMFKQEKDCYAETAERIVALRERLKDTDIEIGWWCSPTIRYYSDRPLGLVMDAKGHASTDLKRCPLAPGLAEDWCRKIKTVAAVRPPIIFIEDDYRISSGRGLDKTGGCFCPQHLALFAQIYGKSLTAAEIAAAFETRTAENLPLRKAFAAATRESMVGLARQARAAIDEIDPTIRVCLCDTGFGADTDGDALEAEIRAFAGKTRPAVRPHGCIYGAETTPARIPLAISHAQFVYERLPKDIETFYEGDTYPHNRFYSSASHHLSLMTGAVSMGTDDFLFYCLQYLDDPFEETGYAMAYRALKPRLEAVRDFIRTRRSRLAGVRIHWTPDDVALTRHAGEAFGHAGQLGSGAYFLSKMSLPYTTRQDAEGPVLLLDGVVEVMSDEEIRKVLSGGALIDAPAAAILKARGFGELLGADVELLEKCPQALTERILPAAGCTRPGKMVNAYFFPVPAGTEATIRRFAKLTPRKGTEVWSEFRDTQCQPLMPTLTVATNALGGRVAVLSMSLIGNRSSGIFNLRKQELFRNLFRRLQPDSLPICALGAPSIWCLANVSADGREMLVTVNNLSGDVRDDLAFELSSVWQGAEVSRLGADGKPAPMGTAADVWRPAVRFGQMEPEFFLFRRGK